MAVSCVTFYISELFVLFELFAIFCLNYKANSFNGNLVIPVILIISKLSVYIYMFIDLYIIII